VGRRGSTTTDGRMDLRPDGDVFANYILSREPGPANPATRYVLTRTPKPDVWPRTSITAWAGKFEDVAAGAGAERPRGSARWPSTTAATGGPTCSSQLREYGSTRTTGTGRSAIAPRSGSRATRPRGHVRHVRRYDGDGGSALRRPLPRHRAGGEPPARDPAPQGEPVRRSRALVQVARARRLLRLPLGLVATRQPHHQEPTRSVTSA
jgi:hypothetical protein